MRPASDPDPSHRVMDSECSPLLIARGGKMTPVASGWQAGRYLARPLAIRDDLLRKSLSPLFSYRSVALWIKAQQMNVSKPEACASGYRPERR